MTRSFSSPGNPVLRAGVHGALAWLVFALVECWLFSVIPMALRPSYAYNPIHPGFTALTLASYPVLGFLLGAVLGAVTGGIPLLRGHAVLGSISLILGLMASFGQLLVQGPDSPFAFRQSAFHLYVPLGMAVLLLVLAVARAADGPDSIRFRFATNPASVGALLLGLPWMTVGVLAQEGTVPKAFGMAGVPVAVLLLGLAGDAIARRGNLRPAARGGLLGLAVIGTFLLATTKEQGVRETGAAPPAGDPGTEARPSIVLITLDTVRADHLSVYGYERETTPGLQRFAEEATLYRESVASGDMTLTTHGSLFTGLYGRQHGAHRSEAVPTGRPLSPKFDTLAEILAEHGYWTQAVVSNTAYLSNTFGFDQGFQFYDVRGAVLFLGKPAVYSPRRWLRTGAARFVPRTISDRRYRDATQINAEVFRRLDGIRDRGAPFFLFVNYIDAHVPLLPPPPYDTRYPGKDETFTTDRYYEILQGVIRGDGTLSETDRAHLESQYDGAISYLDREVQRLFTELETRGLWDNTMVIVTSDHGEAFGEKALINHGVSVYQNLVGIPLIIRYPRQDSPETVDDRVNSVDILPTVADVAGLELPRPVSGQSLRTLSPGRNRAVASESYPFLFDLNPEFLREERAVFWGPLKLVASTTGKRELYDLSRDTDETNNLYDPGDPAVQEMEDRLEGWLEVMVAETDSAAFELDPAARERLKALGYLQ
ncbi:MAG: sulfatase [Gemmatimonadetes bacterium]|nr:sulfatase [Gemmatimonadota bacterium]